MDYLLRCTFPKAICCIPQNYCNILKTAFYKQLVKATKSWLAASTLLFVCHSVINRETLKVNNYRTTSANSINLHIARRLIKYMLKNVL